MRPPQVALSVGAVATVARTVAVQELTPQRPTGGGGAEHAGGRSWPQSVSLTQYGSSVAGSTLAPVLDARQREPDSCVSLGLAGKLQHIGLPKQSSQLL